MEIPNTLRLIGRINQFSVANGHKRTRLLGRLKVGATNKGVGNELSRYKKMSMLERLKTMEALWDSLLYENEGMESPEWHVKIVEKRKLKAAKQNLSACRSR